jgi:hypothetical protein
MITRATLFLLFSLISASILAQQYKVSGKLSDTAGFPLSALTVRIIAGGDTLKRSSDVYGSFMFDKVPSSSFSLLVTGVGYKRYEKTFRFNDGDHSINLPVIEMKRDYTQLKDVVISQPPIVLKEDTVEYKADSFKTKPGAVVEDLLKKLPGVQVDKQGNITAQGKQVTKIKVNGKDFFGSDPQTATKNLPADIVDKVQVVDDYGDQAAFSGMKTGDAEKVINLQLKKDKNEGYFAKVTAGAGTDERYTASATANYFNKDKQISLFSNSNNTNTGLFSFNMNRGMGNIMKAGQRLMNDMGGMGSLTSIMNNGDFGLLGNGNTNNGINHQSSIGVNYSDQLGKKLTLYGSYVFADNRNFNTAITSQQRFFNDSSILYNDRSESHAHTVSHRFFLNMEYKIDSFSTFKISPSILMNTGNNSGRSANTTATQGGNPINSNDQLNTGDNRATNFSGTAIYRKRFRKAGRTFSANFSYGINDSKNNNESYNTPVYQKPFLVQDTSDLLTKSKSNGYNYGVSLSYTEALSKTKLIEFVYRFNRTYSKSTQDNRYIDTPFILPPGGLSLLNNEIDNDFITNTVGVNYRYTQKKYNYTLGLSMQPVDMKSYDYKRQTSYDIPTRWNVIPVFNFNYQYSRSKRLSIFYRGTQRQPQVSQLQPANDLSNVTNITTGNPDLKPEFNNVLSANYNQFNFMSGRLLFANLSITQTSDKIVNDVSFIGGRQLTTYANANGFYNLTGFYTYSKPYKNRRYILTLTGTANYNNNISIIRDTLNNKAKSIGRNWFLSQRFNFEYNFKEWLELGVGAGYNYNYTRNVQPASSSVKSQPSVRSDAWVLSSNGRIDLKGGWVFNFDMDYTINSGLATTVNANTAILNAWLEKQFFKNTLNFRLAGYDLLKQNTNVNRTVSDNTITDTRNNLLTRYFMLTASYRFSRFKGAAALNRNKPGIPGIRF